MQTPEQSRWSWDKVAGLVRDRLILARLAGAAVWLSWLISLGLGGWRHDWTGRPVGADHIQYFVVGKLLDEGQPEKIYDEETMADRQKEVAGPAWTGYLPFRYPPFYALCFAPTSLLPYEASWLVWSALSFLALILSGRLLGVPAGTWIGWSLCFFPVFAAVSYGQNSLISLLLLAVAYALWQSDRPFLAGLAAGLLLYKPFILVGVGLLWLLDLRRSWRALLGLTCMGLALIALSFLALPSTTERFIASLGPNVGMTNRHSLAKLYSSQGFWMLLLLPGFDWLTHPLSLLTSFAGLVVFVTFWRRIRDSKPLSFALAVLATLWLTPYAMHYDWSILLLPAVLLWRERPEQRPRWLLLFALIWLAALVSEPLVQGQLRIAPVALQVSVPALWCTVVVVGVLLTKRQRQ